MTEIVLVVALIVQGIIHRTERKDLYNRIMSRNITEYKNADKAAHIPVSAHRRVLDKWKDRGETK